MEVAGEFLEREAEADPLHEDVDRRGIEYARVRLIQEPLTAYLRYELMAYSMREQLGERIEVVRCDPRNPDVGANKVAGVRSGDSTPCQRTG
jgi:hypothetical protein